MASAIFAGQKSDFEQFRDRLPWIWQSPRLVEPPKVKNTDWPTDPVDRFVLRKLEAEKLKPAGPANDRVWLRRVYFAITGLPPKPEDTQTFLNDTSKNRKRKLVRTLLEPLLRERVGRGALCARADDTGEQRIILACAKDRSGDCWRH